MLVNLKWIEYMEKVKWCMKMEVYMKVIGLMAKNKERA
jgi:hypothetical protein